MGDDVLMDVGLSDVSGGQFLQSRRALSNVRLGMRSSPSLILR